MEAKHIAKKVELSDTIEHLPRNPAFITLKNHQENLNSKLPYRLINPSKSKLRKVSKQKLEKNQQKNDKHLNVNQWKNTASVINWVTTLENKTASVIKFDTQQFYLPNKNYILFGIYIL